VHRARRDAPVEKVAEQLDDGRTRGVANQHKSEDRLTWPCLGDGEVKENIFVPRFEIGGTCQRIAGRVGLLVEELTADPMFPGQVRVG
jgi:hypothetical protein